jgi:hypothetical protein
MDHPRSLVPFEHLSAISAYSDSNYSNNPPSETDVLDRRTDLRGYPVVPQPSVESFDRLRDMCRNGHGPGFYDDTEIAAQSNENNRADLRRAGAGFSAGYSSRAGYSNPFDLSSLTGFLEPLVETPPNATSEVKPSLATNPPPFAPLSTTSSSI